MAPRRKTIGIVIDDVLANSAAGYDLAREKLRDQPSSRRDPSNDRDVRATWLYRCLADTPETDPRSRSAIHTLINAGHVVNLISTRMGNLPGVDTSVCSSHTEQWLDSHGYRWHKFIATLNPYLTHWDFLIATHRDHVTPPAVTMKRGGKRGLISSHAIPKGVSTRDAITNTPYYRNLGEFVATHGLHKPVADPLPTPIAG